jgi:hypothetical protein
MKKTTNGMTRRSVMKKLSAGASISVLGVSGSAAAEKQNLDERDLENVLNKERVQVILREVDSPQIQSSSRHSQTLNGEKWTVTKIETRIGQIKYTESSAGPPVAVFTFDGVDSNTLLPNQYKNVPNINESHIVVEDSTARFIRDVTSRELSKLKSEIDSTVNEDASETVIVYDSKVDGFIVTDYTMNKRYIFEADKIDDISDPDVEFFLTTSCSAGACTQCALSIGGGTGGCASLCKYVRYLGYPGIAACAACLVGAGAFVTQECDQCIDSC